MQLLDELRREHERIDAVAGALRTWSARVERGEASLADRTSFVRFFRVYAGAFHHEREESTLLGALVRDALLPVDRGPIAVIADDHHRMARMLDAIERTGDPAELSRLAMAYSHALWLHIDMENSVLFPESEQQLARNGVRELPTRPPAPDELEAAALGDALIARHPPMEPDLTRGDGCVMCHAYGDACRGLEREWWNEWDWEELEGRLAGA